MSGTLRRAAWASSTEGDSASERGQQAEERVERYASWAVLRASGMRSGSLTYENHGSPCIEDGSVHGWDLKKEVAATTALQPSATNICGHTATLARDLLKAFGSAIAPMIERKTAGSADKCVARPIAEVTCPASPPTLEASLGDEHVYTHARCAVPLRMPTNVDKTGRFHFSAVARVAPSEVAESGTAAHVGAASISSRGALSGSMTLQPRQLAAAEPDYCIDGEASHSLASDLSQHLRRDPNIQWQTLRLWRVATLTRGHMDLAEYLCFHLSCYHYLLPERNFKAEDAIAAGREAFGRNVQPDRDTMVYDNFAVAVFELANVWCDSTTRAEAYVDWLKEVRGVASQQHESNHVTLCPVHTRDSSPHLKDC